jgi:RimJ/RimL family protein N-acetyltransferase
MNLLRPVVLEGARVRLEPLSTAHVAALAEIAAGPRESFSLSIIPRSLEETRAYVADALAAPDQLAFATIDRARGAVVGSTRFCDAQRWSWPPGTTDPRAGEPGLDGVEIGYTWLAPAAQRTAINTESKLLMLAHAFEALRARRVTLKTDARNERSRRAILRLGARLDGILRAWSPAYDGEVRDSAYYSILAAEWPRLKLGLEEKLR